MTDDLDPSPAASEPATVPAAILPRHGVDQARPDLGPGVDDRDGSDDDASDTPAPVPGRPHRSMNRAFVEWAVLIVLAVVVALVIKAFFFQAFYIPSESMVPTLEVGDRVLVNKLSYRLHDVHRGDIVVFRSAPNVEWQKAGIDDLVKRVIGLPGETVTQCDGTHVCIDGRELQETYLPADTPTEFQGTPPGCAPDSPPEGCKVPAGHLFVLGDNRPRSADARLHGPIKESSIVGRVFVRIWPLDRLGFL